MELRAPVPSGELRALHRLRGRAEASASGSPFTTAGVARTIERAVSAAGLELKAHPHMFRHVAATPSVTGFAARKIALPLEVEPATYAVVARQGMMTK
jgi:Phage integrase family